jgi:hypothetical protein
MSAQTDPQTPPFLVTDLGFHLPSRNEGGREDDFLVESEVITLMHNANSNGGETLHEFPLTKGRFVRLMFSEYDDEMRFDFRVWYVKRDSDLGPTLKGVSIPLGNADDLLEAIDAVQRKLVQLAV